MMGKRDSDDAQSPQLGDGHPSTAHSGREPELSGLRASLPPLIVHIDDGESFRLLLALILRMVGYRVMSFDKPLPALTYCQEIRPALIITDYIMPQIDGFTLCERIRTHSNLHDLPIIMISPWYPNDSFKQAERMNIKQILAPYDLFELIEEVDARIRTQGYDVPKQRRSGFILRRIRLGGRTQEEET